MQAQHKTEPAAAQKSGRADALHVTARLAWCRIRFTASLCSLRRAPFPRPTAPLFMRGELEYRACIRGIRETCDSYAECCSENKLTCASSSRGLSAPSSFVPLFSLFPLSLSFCSRLVRTHGEVRTLCLSATAHARTPEERPPKRNNTKKG